MAEEYLELPLPKLLKCPHCPQLYSLEKTMAKHMTKAHPYGGQILYQRKRSFKCDVCKRTFISFKCLFNHRRKIHGRDTVDTSQVTHLSVVPDTFGNRPSEVQENNATDKPETIFPDNPIVNLHNNPIVNLFDKPVVNLQNKPVVNMLDKPVVNMLDKSVVNLRCKPVLNLLDKPVINLQCKPIINMQCKPVVILQGSKQTNQHTEKASNQVKAEPLPKKVYNSLESEKQNKYKCNFCNKKFNSFMDMTSHGLQEHGIDKVKQRSTKGQNRTTSATPIFDKDDNMFKCPYCSKRYTYKLAVTYHLKIEHPKEPFRNNKYPSVEERKTELCHKLSNLVSLATTRKDCEVIDLLIDVARESILDMREGKASKSHADRQNNSTETDDTRPDDAPMVKVESVYSLMET